MFFIYVIPQSYLLNIIYYINFNDFNFHKHQGILYEEFDSFQELLT